MKRTEYLWIGRIVLLMGFAFLMLEAIFDKWVPLAETAKRADGIFPILNCWVFLIPAGYLIVGIATRKKSGIVCAVLALLCSVWSFLEKFEDAKGAVMGVVYTGLEWIAEHEHIGGPVFLVAAMLYTGIVAIAAIRVLFNKRYKAFSVVLGIVTLLLWVFCIISVMGIKDEGSLLKPLREAVLRWRKTDYAEVDDRIFEIYRGIYIGLTSLAAGCCFTEFISSRKTEK